MKYIPYTLQDVRDRSSEELFTVVSTFAGMGGSSLGYRLAGGKVLVINEFVDAAINTYLANFPDTKVLRGDIKQFSGQDFLDAANLKAGELDLFDGSPPCSAFSVAGKVSKGWKGGVDDKRKVYFDENMNIVHEGDMKISSGKKKYSDSQTVDSIEDLFLEFIRIAEVLQPKVIIAENVRGMMFGESKKKYNEFLNAFDSIGYISIGNIVSAVNFNTPQTRERTIFICVRKDVAEAVDLLPSNLIELYPEGSDEIVSVGEALEGVENDPAQVEELLAYVQKSFQGPWVAKLPKNPERLYKASEFHPKGSLFNMIRTCKNMPCPTITQTGQKKSVSGCLHWAEDRKFTIPELKRIQGLPEDFVLTGNFDQQAERIGRSVAPKMMCEIATSVFEKVIRPYNEIQEFGKIITKVDWSVKKKPRVEVRPAEIDAENSIANFFN